MGDTEEGKLDVEEVLAGMRALLGEQGQQIVMLRVALANARRGPGPVTDPRPVPDIND